MSPADKNRYPHTLRPSETSVREDFEATVAAAIARKNRYPECDCPCHAKPELRLSCPCQTTMRWDGATWVLEQRG